MQFYFTCHRQDLTRRRLPAGCRVMLVASSLWNERTRRFRRVTLPVDHLSGWCLDSGGFTAARRWGCYPWTPAQYADWAAHLAEQMPLDFIACLDYACEPAVNRSVYASNLQRIEATLAHEQQCLEADPSLPWLPVLQGDSLMERWYDLLRRRLLSMVPPAHAGIGSICGRTRRAAQAVIRWYGQQLPGVTYHAFGLDCRVMDAADDIALLLESWDSYAWTWAPGTRGQRMAGWTKHPQERYTTYVARLASAYLARTIDPRMRQPRQRALALGDVMTDDPEPEEHFR